MSKKAEQRALEAYPDTYVRYSKIGDPEGVQSGISPFPNTHILERKCYVEGYNQAWKYLKEWVEEQLAILDKQTLLHPDDDVFWGQRNAYKRMKDKLNSL